MPGEREKSVNSDVFCSTHNIIWRDIDGQDSVQLVADRLAEKLLCSAVKGLRPPGCPRSSFNNVALPDCQDHQTSRPFTDAQVRLLCTYLPHLQLKSIHTFVIVIAIVLKWPILNPRRSKRHAGSNRIISP